MNYKKIAQDIRKNQYNDDELLAFGKMHKSESYSRIGVEGANSWRYAIAKAGNDILFIPFSRSGVYYKNMFVLNKDMIKSLELVRGVFNMHLKMTTNDGFEKLYCIVKGRKELNKIVKALGF